MAKKEKSDFGMGLAYCLGLFLAHSERYGEREIKDVDAHLWFNGASDHFYELQVEFAPKKLQKRLKRLQDKALNWGHGYGPSVKATYKSIVWALQEAKDLLREIDKANGVNTVKGTWE